MLSIFFYLLLVPSMLFFSSSLILFLNFYNRPKRFLKKWQVVVLTVLCFFTFNSTVSTAGSSMSDYMYFGVEAIYLNFVRAVLTSIFVVIILDLYLVVFWNKQTFLKKNK